jgi:integrase
MGVKRKRDKWQVDLRSRYVKVVSDEKVARRLFESGERMLDLGKPLEEVIAELRGASRKTPSLDAYFEEWKATLTLPKDTIYRYSVNYKRLGRLLGSRPIAEVTPDDIRKAVKTLSDTYAPKSLWESVGILRSLYLSAIDSGLVQRSPAARIKNLPTKEAQREPRVMSRAEYRTMVAGFEEYYRPLVATWPLLGLRPGEMLGLKPNDVSDVVRVRRQLHYRTHSLERLKTRQSKRDVPLIPEARKWLQTQRERSCGPLLFQTPSGAPISRTRLREMFLESGFNPHDMRHTYGSWLLAAGMPLPEVSRLMGHKTVAITARCYAHQVGGTSNVHLLESFLGDDAGTSEG